MLLILTATGSLSPPRVFPWNSLSCYLLPLFFIPLFFFLLLTTLGDHRWICCVRSRQSQLHASCLLELFHGNFTHFFSPSRVTAAKLCHSNGVDGHSHRSKALFFSKPFHQIQAAISYERLRNKNTPAKQESLPGNGVLAGPFLLQDNGDIGANPIH